MYVPVLIAILIVCLLVFGAWRLVKEKNAEEKERTAEEMKKAAPDPNESH
jgi:FtsZ-interacting cell division protein ZipA